jgi:hypothetical protein
MTRPATTIIATTFPVLRRGRPHFGHDGAWSETSDPHSEHFTSAIAHAPLLGTQRAPSVSATTAP